MAAHEHSPGDRGPAGCHHPGFQRRSWMVQRCAWGVMAAVIGAALAGAFGRGPLVRRQVASPDGSLVVRFDRVIRNNAPARLQVTLEAGPDSGAMLWLDRAYLDRFDIESLQPEPDSMTIHPDRVALHYRLSGGGGTLTLLLEPRDPGSASGAIGVGQQRSAQRSANLEQWILP